MVPKSRRVLTLDLAFASLLSNSQDQRRETSRGHRRRHVYQVSFAPLLSSPAPNLTRPASLSLMRSYFATIGDSAHPDHPDSRVRAITNFQELLGSSYLLPSPYLYSSMLTVSFLVASFSLAFLPSRSRRLPRVFHHHRRHHRQRTQAVPSSDR
jgi:hypothetical protein